METANTADRIAGAVTRALLLFHPRNFGKMTVPWRWGFFRQTQFFTLPLVILAAFAIWFGCFVVLYDGYVVSLGAGSYFDYAARAPIGLLIKSTWNLVGRRDTAGIFALSAVLATPLMLAMLVIWMLKSGRGFSRHILYLLHIRSMRRLFALLVVGQFLVVAALVAYFLVFYIMATAFEKRADLALFYSQRPLTMTTAPFGGVDPAGHSIAASRDIGRAGILGLLAAIAVLSAPVVLGLQKRGRMVYGSARLGNLTDAADFGLLGKRGVVLGTKQGKLLVDDSDKHVLVIGSPGQGKSRSLVIPSMMRFGGSMFILDFGSELYKDMAGWLQANGYATYVIAPGKKETDGFNPFDFVSADPDDRITSLQKQSLMIMPERSRSDSSDFWEESARILLTALMGFIIECPDTRKTLGELQHILGSMPDERQAISQLLERYESVLSDATRMQFEKFRGRHEKLGEGIAAEIGARLDILQNRNLEAMLSATTIPLRDIRNRKMAVFLDVDIQTVRIYERFISMIIETAMDIFVGQGPLRDGQHDVMVMLDEFGNAGRLETILTQAPLMRKYGIRFVSILQDSAQLDRLYERAGREIITGSSTIKLYMNFQNPRDAQYVATLAGKTTEWISTSSYTYRHGRRDRQASRMPVQKDLLSVSDLMMLQPEESILHVAGAPVFKLLKVEGSDDLRFAAFKNFKAPERPKMHIVEADNVDKSAVDRPSARIVYVSSLDGLRNRLGLCPPRKASGDSDHFDHDGARDAISDPTLFDLRDGARSEQPAWHATSDQTMNREAPDPLVGIVPARSPVLTEAELSTGFNIGAHEHWELPEGLFDGSIHPENLDPATLNTGIMALVGRLKAVSTSTDVAEAFERLTSIVSDPLGEETAPQKNV